MATKLYLQNANAGQTPSGWQGFWHHSSSGVTKRLGRKAGSETTVIVPETSTTNNYMVAMARFVSDPLGVNTFDTSDTTSLIVRMAESNAAANNYLTGFIYILKPDGGVRGVLRSSMTAASELTTSAVGVTTGVLNNQNTITTVAGDRIVVEVGYQARNTVATSYSSTLYYGGTGGDLGIAGSSGVASVTFSNDVVWQDSGSRYAVASGAFNSNSTWAYIDGGVAGATAPVAGNNVMMFENVTVNLTADAECYTFDHRNGTLSLSSYTLRCEYSFNSAISTTARTLNFGSGKVIVSPTDSSPGGFYLNNSNLTFNSGTSTVILNTYFDDTFEFYTGSQTFNDVQINLGVDSSNSTGLSITGSPTFRSLIIQSKNSAAHTVTFYDNITVDKLIAIGSSSSNRLIFNSQKLVSPEFWRTTISFSAGGTSYGKYVDLRGLGGSNGYVRPAGSGVPFYIGSESIQFSEDSNWLIQDPPKISTLVDPLTTTPGSNSNWSIVGGTASQISTGAGGGGYRLSRATTGVYYLLSTDTYDLIDNWLVIEGINNADENASPQLFIDSIPNTDFSAMSGITAGFSYDSGGLYNRYVFNLIDTKVSSAVSTAAVFDAVALYISSDGEVKVFVRNQSTKAFVEVSNSISLSETDLLLLRSSRLYVGFYGQKISSPTITGDVLSVNVLKIGNNPGAFLQFF